MTPAPLLSIIRPGGFVIISITTKERWTLTLAQAATILQAETVVAAACPEQEVAACFAADLMSDVLAFASPGAILLTGLTTDQAIRTAAVKQLCAVFIIQGKQAGNDMIEAALEERVPLFRTSLSKYEACGLLMQSGLPPCPARGGGEP